MEKLNFIYKWSYLASLKQNALLFSHFTFLKNKYEKKEKKFKHLLTLEASLAEDLKCTGLEKVKVPFIEIVGVSP